MAVTSEPGGNIALMRAVLPSLVSDAHEGLTAVRAYQAVFSFGRAFVVGVPPCCTTFVRAELSRFTLILYFNGASTLLAGRCLDSTIFGKPIPSAKGLYCIFGNGK